MLPGRTVTITDSAAYGMIMMQGHGKMGVWDIETPTMIRFERTHKRRVLRQRIRGKGRGTYQ